MEGKHKIIAVILIILLILMGSYAIITYKNAQDNNEFKELLKNASNLENITDEHYKEAYSGKSMSGSDFKSFTESILENCTKESDMLIEFKNKTFNQTQKEYLEIEINRLQKEQQAKEKAVDNANQYQRYLNGEITASKYKELSGIIDNDTDRIENEIGMIKEDAITYINNHQDLKDTLKELNIDEDFYKNELGGTSGNGVIYLTK